MRQTGAAGVLGGAGNPGDCFLAHYNDCNLQAGDALRMMRQTGAAGVLVGRGCLGRPWLFAELHDAFEGRAPRPPPDLSGAKLSLQAVQLML